MTQPWDKVSVIPGYISWVIFSGEQAGTDVAVLVIVVPPAQIQCSSFLALKMTCFYNPQSGELISFTLKKTRVGKSELKNSIGTRGNEYI